MPPLPNATVPDTAMTSSRTALPRVLVAAALVLLALAWGGVRLWPQMAMAPSALPPGLAVHEDQRNIPLTTDTPSELRLSNAGPEWKDLTATQREILQPLHLQWPAMGGLTKRRWLVLAQLYPGMSEKEQGKLHERMQTWASLSAQQRNQARLNFSNVKRLTPAELAAKWAEYQALSQAEKQRLAEQARATQKAVQAKRKKRRLTRVPAAASAPTAANPPKILPPAAPLPTPPLPLPAETNAIAAPVVTPRVAPAQALPPMTEAAPLPVQVPQQMHTMDLPPLQGNVPLVESAATTAPTPPVHPETTQDSPRMDHGLSHGGDTPPHTSTPSHEAPEVLQHTDVPAPAATSVSAPAEAAHAP